MDLETLFNAVTAEGGRVRALFEQASAVKGG